MILSCVRAISNLRCIITVALFLTPNLLNANDSIKKDVYSFTDQNGRIVFSDRKPNTKQDYTVQTIEGAGPSTDPLIKKSITRHSASYSKIKQVKSTKHPSSIINITVEKADRSQSKINKKKRSEKQCKTYKKKFTHYSNKMKAGYKSTEYNKLEDNRKKYRKLLFINCATKTFID